MKPKMIDVLIYITLIPAVVFGILSWCGREEWVLRRVPKSAIGAYMLYLALVVWHFHGMSWVVVALAAAGIIVCAIAAYKGRRLKQARDWPVVEGPVLHVGEGRDADGFINVTVTYTYKVQDERYGGSESFAFTNDEDAARFKDACKEQVEVHYRPDKPHVSVVARESPR